MHYRDRLRVLAGRFPEERQILDSAEHLHYFTVPTFCELLEYCGFRVQEVDGNFSVPFPLKMLPRSAKRRLGKWWPNLFVKQMVVKATP